MPLNIPSLLQACALYKRARIANRNKHGSFRCHFGSRRNCFASNFTALFFRYFQPVHGSHMARGKKHHKRIGNKSRSSRSNHGKPKSESESFTVIYPTLEHDRWVFNAIVGPRPSRSSVDDTPPPLLHPESEASLEGKPANRGGLEGQTCKACKMSKACLNPQGVCSRCQKAAEYLASLAFEQDPDVKLDRVNRATRAWEEEVSRERNDYKGPGGTRRVRVSV